MRKTTKLRQKLQISHSDVICALRYCIDILNGWICLKFTIVSKIHLLVLSFEWCFSHRRNWQMIWDVNRRHNCFQTLVLLLKFVASEEKESFVTRTPVLLVDTSDIAIGDVSVSIAIVTIPDTINCTVYIFIYLFIYLFTNSHSKLH